MAPIDGFALAIEQTGYSEVLSEQLRAPPAIYREVDPTEFRLVMSERDLELAVSTTVRYLTRDEQRIFDSALRRSAKLIRRGKTAEG